MPIHLLNAPNRKVTQEEYDAVYTIEDRYQNRRSSNSCMVCSNNGTNRMALMLCCLSMVCVSCIVNHIDESSFDCHYCAINLSSLDARRVILAPQSVDRPKTDTAVQKLINEWRATIQTAQQKKKK
jgi:hypothetical protein